MHVCIDCPLYEPLREELLAKLHGKENRHNKHDNKSTAEKEQKKKENQEHIKAKIARLQKEQSEKIAAATALEAHVIYPDALVQHQVLLNRFEEDRQYNNNEWTTEQFNAFEAFQLLPKEERERIETERAIVTLRNN